MRFATLFVNRPVMAVAVNLVLVIIGIVAYQRLDLRHKPNVAQNEIRITTNYPGANSLAVEHQVTKPLEDALAGLDGIRKLNSTSQDGQSQIFVKFKPNVDSHKALSQVRDRVFMSLSTLPSVVKRPEVEEEAENSRSILYLAFEDKTRSIAALSDYIRRTVVDRLRLVDGVAEVNYFGDKLYRITIEIDPARLALHEVTVNDVVQALNHEKAFATGGEIEGASGKEMVVLTTPIESYDEFKNVTVKNGPNGRITVGDVSDVKLTEKSSYFMMRVDGRSMVGLEIKPKPQANPLKVAERVRSFVEELKNSMPPSMTASVIYDATTPFSASFIAMHHALWEAIVLVGIIVTVSLASFRAAILPMITVPLCLISTFAMMWILGFSVNPITLLALVLAVGLVVDDAIVVVENIHRHMEEGLSALQAARKGMKEISFAVIVMTITLAAVYLPVAFQADDSAVMFKEFAWTLASSVLISGFVALTLTPALCGKFLKDSKKIPIFETLSLKYHHQLSRILQHPKKMVGLLFIIALLGVWGFMRLPSELIPVEDENHVYGYVSFEGTVTKPVRDSWYKAIEDILQTIPERERVLTGAWQDTWLYWHLLLKPRDERNRGTDVIAKELQTKFKSVVGPIVGVDTGGSSDLGGEESLKVILQYSGDQLRLLDAIRTIMKEAREIPGFDRLSSDQTAERPRISATIDRGLASELGVNIEGVENALYTFLSGRKATDYNFQGLDYEVLVQAPKELRSEWSSLNELFVTGSEGQWIPLGSLVTLKEISSPNQIKHYDRMRGASITVVTKPDLALEKAMKLLEPIVKKNLPAGASYRFGGKAETYREAKQSMWLTFALALIFIYLVLSALFESFIHPFVVLLTVPLSVAGGVWAINAIGGSNNIYTAIGFVTLIGLITKHGILIVDFANRLRASGVPLLDATLQSAESRLRPVLMTTLAMIFGAIPLVFSVGAGAIARKDIGWVIIGGMSVGTVLSLLVIPAIYYLVNARTKCEAI